jgi:pimeloyl-ACP methyl ester carboxylesterase
VRLTLSFWHGMNRLAGDLMLPPWQGPHPVAIFVPDEGAATRDQGTWQHRLAAAGIATFSYDKPGCGESTGDWTLQTLQDRAAEAVVAIDLIRGHDAVSANDLALIGIGEGAWAALLAAAQSYAAAALVTVSCGALGPLELEQYRLGRRMNEAGHGSAEVALAQTLLRERVRRLTAGEGPDSVLASEAAVHRAGWYRFMPGASPEEIAAVARLSAFDPRPALSAVHCPMLALYGALDAVLPVERNTRMLTSALNAARHEDHSVIVVPGADHGLRITATLPSPAPSPTPSHGQPLSQPLSQPPRPMPVSPPMGSPLSPPIGLVAPGPPSPSSARSKAAGVVGDLAPGVTELVATWLDRRLGRVDAPTEMARY